MTNLEIAAFYQSWEWKKLRYDALKRYGRKCLCCGAKAPQVRIVVDHIKPIRKRPDLRLKISNCQTLCDPCNVGKSSRCTKDWRPK